MTTFDLFSSVRDGNVDVVRKLLQSKACRARLNDRNEWGDTALHLAAEAGNGEICQMLTAAGASVTVRNNRGETCLHRASVGGHEDAVRAIVGKDQDPEAVNSQNDAGYTSLHHAAKHGSENQINILVKAGADQMIENNAGETPYMVAHKYQQWEAERLLLNVEQQHAEKAILEMNRKEKDIVRGFLSAVKYASQLESRVRVMLIGDTGSGKTSLKKTLSGEPYEPGERATSGINADPSVTRVTCKQFKEWQQHPGTNADTYRLNLEYIDIVIDYILNFVRQPQIVSDDRMDPSALQITRDQPKNVNFRERHDVIPVSKKYPSYLESCGMMDEDDSGQEEQGEEEKKEEGSVGNVDDVEQQEQSSIGSYSSTRSEPIAVRGGVSNGRSGSSGGSGSLSSYSSSVASSTSSPRKGGARSNVSFEGDFEDLGQTCLSPEDNDSCISYLDKEEGEQFKSANSDDEMLSPHDPVDRTLSEGSSGSLSSGKSISNSGSQTHGRQGFSGTGSGTASMSGSGTREGSTSSGDRAGVGGADAGGGGGGNGGGGGKVNGGKGSAGKRGGSGSGGGGKGSKDPKVEDDEQGSDSQPKPVDSSMLIFNRTRHEMSRLLVEKLPLELLKRMVIRWPVGDEHHTDRSSLSANRIALTVWDASGDPLQANFIPFFFSDQTLFVVSYNLSTKLDQPCQSYEDRKLRNVDGSVPTNGEVLESWLGSATAFTKRIPSEPFRCSEQTPILPPIILTCTKCDHPSLENAPILFHHFFERPTFKSYKKHLVVGDKPSALRLSSLYETLNMRSEKELDVPYSGHHILRREIEYLTRYLPFYRDNIPIQWVKFEQLIFGLQQQKKLIVLYSDLSRYVAEHCRLVGPLQILPVLSHYHDIGTIIHFYRHPDLSQMIITKPQWLMSVLGSVITSNPIRSFSQDVQGAYRKVNECGFIPKEMLHLAFRCARLRQKHWNEVLFILNGMDLLTCHPSLHKDKSVYMPAMVTLSAPSPFMIPTAGDPLPIHFRSSFDSAIPIALFNQLVVRCIRSSQYKPVLHHKLAHLRLNSSYHLLLWLEHTSIVVLVQAHADRDCAVCTTESSEKFGFDPTCSRIEHLIGDVSELMSTDNISILIEKSTNSSVNSSLHLALPDIPDDEVEADEEKCLRRVCSKAIKFVTENLQFLCNCWFPGLDLYQCTKESNGSITVLDQSWKYNVLYEKKADERLAVWFSD